MTQHEIAIIALLIAQAVTLYFLWLAKEESDHWRAMWLRDAIELLQWKRYGLMRDPATGRYKRKGDL